MGLFEDIRALPVIDTHEHLGHECGLSRAPDIIQLMMPYVCDALHSAGLPIEDWNAAAWGTAAFEARWALIKPYWEDVQFTAYGETMLRSLSEHFGVTQLDEAAVARVNAGLAAQARPAFLGEECARLGLERVYTYMDAGLEAMECMSDSLLEPVPTVSQFCPRSRGEWNQLGEGMRVGPIRRLGALEEAIERTVACYAALGIKAIKLGNAYGRKLDFAPPDDGAAQKVLDRVAYGPLRGTNFVPEDRREVLSYEEVKPLDDWMTAAFVRAAARAGLAVVIHAGLHAWNLNQQAAAHAAELEWLISAHPEARFVLLHGGIPFIDEAILLARYYPNVHLNMAWMPTIDRVQSREALSRFLEALPLSKLSVFGGDHCYVQNLCGALRNVQDCVADVLEARVKAGLSVEGALRIAEGWFYSNPKRVFGAG